eukprot:TRINITY_DN33284_c0_g1_i1.p1 TRINITY_DN33284_c0_g1~~TRINITY_DN33284_c0_g1_i1.p1  ORF type:complete len:581 (-),score=90.52 TRINITY_DN33284_c0_g1_i1:71-1813(-)
MMEGVSLDLSKSESNRIKVLLSLLGGKLLEIYVSEDTVVRALKQEIALQLDLKVYNFCLVTEKDGNPVIADDSMVMSNFVAPDGSEQLKMSLIKTQQNLPRIFSTHRAFAALKDSGTVVTWGSSDCGGDCEVLGKLNGCIANIFSNDRAFAAITKTGAVAAWGAKPSGGDITFPYSGTNVAKAKGGEWGESDDDVNKVQEQLKGNVIHIHSTATAFAALKSDGSVVTWGDPMQGGDSSGVEEFLQGEVTQICPSSNAFAAVKGDGSVVAWGDAESGGDRISDGRYEFIGFKSAQEQLQGKVVSRIFSTTNAFAALTDDGAVVTWGSVFGGGDSSDVQEQLHDVKFIYSNEFAFAALKKDGSVVSWCDKEDHEFNAELRNVSGQLVGDVVHIASTSLRFAALKKDGSVVSWGVEGGEHLPAYRGVIPFRNVQDQLKDITHIYSNKWAFAAVTSKGAVITWGSATQGGNGLINYGTEEAQKKLKEDLQDNVVGIYSTDTAFVAVRSDGRVAQWGYVYEKASFENVQQELISGEIVHIYSTEGAFAALMADDRIVTWGSQSHGGRAFAQAEEELLPTKIVSVY